MSISDIEAMNGDEFDEWKAYFRNRVFTHELIDFHLAKIALFVAQSMGGNKMMRLKDLLILPYKKKKSVQQMAAEFTAVTS